MKFFKKWRRKLFLKRHNDLVLDLFAFFGDRLGKVTTTEEQLSYMIRLLKQTNIQHSLAVHLYKNPSLKQLFCIFRDLVEKQSTEQSFYNLESVALEWATKILEENGQLTVTKNQLLN